MQNTVHVARVVCDELTARRIADALSERFDGAEVPISTFEVESGRWSTEAYFQEAPDATDLRDALASIDQQAAESLTFATVEPRDWVAASLEGLKPVEAGRFIVHGAHDRAAISTNRIGIEIEAALAFGTGHHGTTRGCLLALDRLAKSWPKRPSRHANTAPRLLRRPRILDVGTGTGVLAMAAHKVFRTETIASDIDPSAVQVARGNVQLNRVPSITLIHAPGVSARLIQQHAPYDIVFANILLPPLKRLARSLRCVLRPGARVILSGLLPEHANAARAAYRLQGLSLERRIDLDGWVTLVTKRGNSRVIPKSGSRFSGKITRK